MHQSLQVLTGSLASDAQQPAETEKRGRSYWMMRQISIPQRDIPKNVTRLTLALGLEQQGSRIQTATQYIQRTIEGHQVGD